jgi:uncharacterized protein (TIGR02246 family)
MAALRLSSVPGFPPRPHYHCSANLSRARTRTFRIPPFGALGMTLFKPVSLFLLALAGPLTAQTAQPADGAAARRAIQAGNAAYIAAFKRADATALAQVYDLEGARLNQGGVVVRGRDAIADDLGKFVAKVGPVRVSLDTKDLWLVGDTAYETGVWSYAFQPTGKPEQRIGGHYVTLWKRQPDDGWKIWADMSVPGT